jgi:hypothetical protein
MLSRLSILFMLVAASTLSAQTSLWSHVSPSYNPPQTPHAQLTQAERAAIRNLLRSPAQRDVWECGDDPNPDWVNDNATEVISLAPGHKTLLVEAGPGCARGGQGANGAMWIVELHGSRASVLASPKKNFSGWLYSVQPNRHNMYSDIVVGWHMSAFESDLTYFRFNGHSYISIGGAILKSDGGGNGTLVPSPPAPFTRQREK